MKRNKEARSIKSFWLRLSESSSYWLREIGTLVRKVVKSAENVSLEEVAAKFLDALYRHLDSLGYGPYKKVFPIEELSDRLRFDEDLLFFLVDVSRKMNQPSDFAKRLLHRLLRAAYHYYTFQKIIDKYNEVLETTGRPDTAQKVLRISPQEFAQWIRSYVLNT